jgi:hypothetical protein
VRIKLSERGLELQRKLDAVFDGHARLAAKSLGSDDFAAVCDTLRRLERFWDDQRTGAGATAAA